MSRPIEKLLPCRTNAMPARALILLSILLVAMAIGTPIGSAFPIHRDRTLQNRTGENASLAAKCGIQGAGYLNQYGWSAYIGKSDAPSARRNRILTGLFLGTYVPGVSYTAYPAQYGQNFIPLTRPATSRFGRDPPVRLQPSTVYDGSMGYDGTSGFSLAAESTASPEAKGGTYLLRDPENGQVVRTGRTNDLARRELEHGRDPALNKYDFEEVYRTDNYAEQRGLEQNLHDQYNPPLNKIRPISPTNPKVQKYLDAAKSYLRSLEDLF